MKKVRARTREDRRGYPHLRLRNQGLIMDISREKEGRGIYDTVEMSPSMGVALAVVLAVGLAVVLAVGLAGEELAS